MDGKAQIGEGAGDDLGAAVVSILAHLGDEDGRGAAPRGLEALDAAGNGGEFGVVAIAARIDAGDDAGDGGVAAEHVFHGLADLAQGGAGARRLDGGFEQIALVLGRIFAQGGEHGLALGLVAGGADALELGDLFGAHLGIVDLAHFDRVFAVEPIAVDAHDHFLAPVDAGLAQGGGLFDLELGSAGLHRLGHAALGFGLGDQGASAFDQLGGQRFHIVGASERVDHVGDAAFVLQDQLGITRDAAGEFGGERNGLVEAVGMEALRAAQGRGQGLDGGADDVVVRVLLGERDARGLAMGAQHLGAGLLGAKPGHDLAPELPRGTELGNFEEEVHADAEKEGEAPGKGVDIEAARLGGADIFHAVGQRIGQFLHRRRAGLVHMVARDGDGVELGHVPGGMGDDVAHDPHGGLGRIDIGVADHELLEDVVLNGAVELGLADALFLGRDDEHGQDRDHRAVHGHGDRHLIERNTVEEDFHVLHRVDGDAGLADIAGDAGMVAVIAAMGGEVEGDREALLALFQRLAVEGVGFARRGEAGILADGPGPVGIHGRAYAAGEGFDAGDFGAVAEIDGLDRDAAIVAGEGGKRGVAQLLLRQGGPFLLFGVVAHYTASNSIIT